MNDVPRPIHVIGGGLAGSEAVWQIAAAGVPVILHEMRPVRRTDAHRGDSLAELVCSNSLRSDDAETNAVGVLHREMRRMGSLVMRAADANQVPAGGALAVDREAFAAAVTEALAAHPLVEIRREEVEGLPPADWDNVIVATGPLTSPALAAGIGGLTGESDLAFFDAIAPVVHRETIDMSKAWFQSRYDKAGPGGTGADYINCPLSREQYEAFVDALLSADVFTSPHDATTPYFDGCLPIEEMARRGRETLRHGPMKPVGLTNPHAPTQKPCAVVQLRQDNALGTLYNMVGFQTKMRHAAQVAVFKTIPGLEEASFARLGGIHRNTFLNAPKLLDATLRLRAQPRLRFAGQITGCEGYVESAAIGLIAGRLAAAERQRRTIAMPPATTAIGALINHITGGHVAGIDPGPRSFQPMNVNFGLFPPIDGPTVGPDGRRLRGPEKGVARKIALSRRAAADLDAWLAAPAPALAAE
ncbi:Methylenetetrahydrofolate--tRNA-(uracil-5-)-methyltransferase TrmFO [Beijerinckiaceae bacterium RH AL1]|nr:Methylenetetrahydrofolate--tRNA-(uracil-5-)-methyltransferase TrmFO [Beijerinckiaceae bacterium RH CH11]VVB45036.1 Methylenetetrahydrofolate--tRNA-(uracil-5-)-methyltransferase TrmFO [Beijerinckiaceae bacterium RH AL8]VVC54624.1 Methylenetetrahydrofolate--tRNA-(uracil-5-)-methyltransferase TrmFO [Beijerinckiaceae bacterium RH AL1]